MARKFINLDDTIAAVATPCGVGGIGIVRLSGNEAIAIADKMFVSPKAKKLSCAGTFTVHYGNIRAFDDEAIDEVLVTVMRAPKSYTCEDVVEISAHGGFVAVQAILSLAIKHGARLAEPGEFTRRAFLNGRIDLAQAEAVLDMIHAKTEAFLKVSTHQLKGDLTHLLESLREALMQIYVEAEAVVNFPEEGIDSVWDKQLQTHISSNIQKIEHLLQTHSKGKILKEGLKIVLCGKVNVGKSSLLNIFLEHPRAIVSHVEGTTRDTIEEFAQLGDVPVRFVDTAGILEPRDDVERQAIERSRLAIKSADLILFLLDNSRPVNLEDKKIMECISKKNLIIVINKCDLKQKFNVDEITADFSQKDIVKVSVLRKEGLDDLKTLIEKKILSGQSFSFNECIVSSMRHAQALDRCVHSLKSCAQHLKEGLSLEFVCEDLKQAIHELDLITGRDADYDLLDRIFSEFCIGK